MQFRFRFIRGICLILFLIAFFSFLISMVKHSCIVSIMGWRKGPVIDPFFPFSHKKVPVLFLATITAFIGLYLFLSFFIDYIIRQKLPRYFRQLYIITIAISIISAFCLVEIGLGQYLKRHQLTFFRPHPVLFWQVRPNLRNFVNYVDKEGITTNSLGLRGEDVPFRKRPKDFRILVLGDSSNFGNGVDNNETWAYQLESMLKETFRSRNINVINGSCPGYTTYGGLIFLKQTGLQFQPDVLIIGFNNDDCKDYMEDKRRGFENPLLLKIKINLYKSDFYLLLRQVALGIKAALMKVKNSCAAEKIDGPVVYRVSLEDYKRNILEFIKIAHYYNIRLVFMNMPVNQNVLESNPELKERFYNEMHRQALRNICEEYSQIFVDINNEWSSLEEKDLFFPRDTLFHPNPKGHRLIAQRFYKVILQENLIR